MAKLTLALLFVCLIVFVVSAQQLQQQPEIVEIQEEVPSSRVKRWGYGGYGPYGGFGPYGHGPGTTVIKKVIIHRPGYGGYGGGYGGYYGGGWGHPYYG
ncbi:hypothetical protein QR680_002235 [Steinernema hermaphroditum]|uniref:Uncharacterized protein n=1 Tax=Steinernema hermaphroditum TaxID=289476 RepID=A0AA39LHR0_9BILA|nr:hypothetical protein QR680_002235 [Steinernema hermaphroditum]